MTSLTKKPETQIQKIFFIADMKTCQIFWGLEQITSTIVGGDAPMQKHLQTAGF